MSRLRFGWDGQLGMVGCGSCGAVRGLGRRRGVLGSALLALLVLALTAGVASAHANLVRSNPAAGASLKTSPGAVQLWFSEALEPSFSRALVYDPNRQRVDLGDSHVAPDDPTSLIVSVKPNLSPGTYVIAWTTQSKVDGHVLRGLVPFGVGVASAPVTSSALQGLAAGPVSGSPAEMALRWIILLGAAALAGSFAFWLLQADVGGDRHDSEPDPIRGQLTLVAVAGAAFIVANVALLLLQTSIAADVPLLATLGAPVVQVLTGTQFGTFWLVRLVLALLIGVVVLARARGAPVIPARTWDRLGLVLGAGLLATISLTSHGAAAETPTPIGLLPLGLVVDWVHLAAVAVWIGGLLQLAAIVPSTLGRGRGEAGARFLGALVPRFAVVAGIALTVVGLTGVVQALQRVQTLDNLLNSAYGQALLVKILLIVPLVALAAINHFLIRPALARARYPTSTRSVREALRMAMLFRWTVRLEVLFAVAVIAAVGVMTSLGPPVQSSAAAGADSLTLTAPAGDLVTTFTLAPGRPGPNRYTVAVQTSNGPIATNVQQVYLRFTFLDSDLGVAQTVLQPTGNGRFTGQSSDLAVAGRWQGEVIVRRPGHDDVRSTYGFSVTPTGPQTLQAPQPQVGWPFYAALLVAIVGAFAIVRGLRLRRIDLLRAAVLAVCGVGLISSGGYFAFQNVQQAQAQAASQALGQLHPATPQSIADGAAVFRQNCAICHGLDARGDGPMAASLNPRPSDLVLHVPLHPDADLENWIANGFPGSAMPAFKAKLTDQQRWDVLNYLKTIASSAANPGGASGVSPPSPSPAAGAPPATTTADLAVAAAPPAVSPSPTPVGGGLAQGKRIGNLDVAVQIQPSIYQPATIEVRLADPHGKTPTDVRRVDLELAMEGMDHGARGIVASAVGPGDYQVRAMLLAMEGPWWLAVRIERTNGQVSSGVFAFRVPRDTSNEAVSAMYSRPPGPVQVEDVAVYPSEVTPGEIAVTAGHPVRLEVMYVDHPACGPSVRVASAGLTSPVSPDGLAEVTFTPGQSGKLSLACQSTGLVVQ